MDPQYLQFAYQHAASSIRRVQQERLARTRTLTTLRECNCSLISNLAKQGVSEEQFVNLLNSVCFFSLHSFFCLPHHHCRTLLPMGTRVHVTAKAWCCMTC